MTDEQLIVTLRQAGHDYTDRAAARIEALATHNMILDGALRLIEYLDRPQVRGLPRRVTIQEIALSALTGDNHEAAPGP